LIVLYGITKTELNKFFSGNVSTSKLKPTSKEKFTYMNPETGEKWIGNIASRGRRPNWVRDFVADGKIEECLVKDEHQSSQ
jgi:DNA-binding protein H-NS